ncbi:dystrotelin [Anabas testudineus]|uniref:dystrotelin n=1 Tax=Anabas testudineus TaxID=64144 RepID=UPI000E457881|nr:dystrotelin [Anabas testudineus]
MSALCWLLIGQQAAGDCNTPKEGPSFEPGFRIQVDAGEPEESNKIRASVYRVATKLESLQRLCHSEYHNIDQSEDSWLETLIYPPVDVVSIGPVVAAVHSVIGPQRLQDVGLNREEVTRTLNRMFNSVDHVAVPAPGESCSLMFRLYDRTQTGRVSAASLQTALIALSADNLLDKYRALIGVSENSSGCVSRSGLRSLLQDLSQIPLMVQEEAVFGSAEAAVRSCFNKVMTPTVGVEHVLLWLQSNPQLLLWLPALYRLSITQNICHTVRCHTCKTFPITGLRFRCMKCVNVHVCQCCFLTDRQTRKHKIHHPVLEFCTQPTWRESLSSLLYCARYALLPWRHTQREADLSRILMWVEPGETQNSGPPPSDTSTLLVDSAVHQSPASDRDVSQDASVHPLSSSSKALQTDEETTTQQTDAAALLSEVRNLHRDKWLLEQELQVWRLTVQSEHGLLEDRCSEMEVTIETLRQHHLCLQKMLTQALNNIEVQKHDTPRSVDTETRQPSNHTPRSVDTETRQPSNQTPRSVDMQDTEGNATPTSDSLIADEDDQLSHDLYCEEEPAGDRCLSHAIGREEGPKEAELQREDTRLPEEEENCGMSSSEKWLQETVDGLRNMMETNRWRERQKDKRVVLLEAANQVGESIHYLVDALRTNTL